MFRDKILFFVFIVNFLFCSIYAQNDLFDVKINSIDRVLEGYLINFDIEPKINEEVDIKVYSIYERENLEVGYQKFSCDLNKCNQKLLIDDVFEGKHILEIEGKYNRLKFIEKISYEVDNSLIDEYYLDFKEDFFIDKNVSGVNLNFKLNTNTQSEFYIEIVPKSILESISSYQLNCESNCNFEINLESPFILGEYFVNVYSILGEKQYTFNLLHKENNLSSNLGKIEDDDSQLNSTINLIETENKNNLIKKKSVNENIFNETGKKEKDIVESRIVKKILISGEEEEIEIFKNQDFLLDNNTLAIISQDETLRVKNNNLNVKSFEEDDLNLESGDLINGEVVNKTNLKPGIYVVEHSNGSSELFAYGLISINTKKSLYQKNEIVKVILVVLDSQGYLYSSADINLEIEFPDTQTYFLSTQSRSIVESQKNGVYFAYFNASQVGEYKFRVETQVEDYNLYRETYVNVVEELDYEIERLVPATIDPWLGPFRNEFIVSSKTQSIENYFFEEIIPASFEITQSNADEVEVVEDNLILRWFNLNENPLYFAQVPLITPYLYTLGKSRLFLDTINFNFIEDRAWQFAIDPIVNPQNTYTCTDFWGSDCGAWPASSEGDNTFDSCVTSEGGVGDENVMEVTITTDSTYPGNQVNVTCTFDPYSTGTEEYIYYYDTTSWTQLYSGRAPSGSVHEVSSSVTVGSNLGTHYFRCIVDWNGENDECASQGNYYDNDDVGFVVRSPFLTLNTPQNISYSRAAIPVNISTDTLANIAYRFDSNSFKTACNNCNSFYKLDILTQGSHRIEVVAIDISTGYEDRWIEYFYVETDDVNPQINTSGRTCSDTFGFYCGNWPASSEGDNTFDTCPTSIGNAGDENVVEVILSQSSIYLNNNINVTCVFDPYDAGSEEYIYYYDTNSWTQIYSGNPVDGNIHNISVEVPITQNEGTHYFRCIIDWDGENDECADGGSYYDNDDVSFEVYEEIAVPFELIVVNPQELVYVQPYINYEFRTSKNATIGYYLDGGPFVTACSSCTYFNSSFLFRDGTYNLNISAWDDETSEMKNYIVDFEVNTSSTAGTINTSGRTCTDTFGLDCSLWPASSEGDNTFDSCPTSVGSSNDEHVNEVEVNMSSVIGGTFVDITCYFDPFNANTEEYIYYYDTNSWTQIYFGNPADGNEHTITQSVQISNVSGTHYFRCIVDWDGENDQCANSGSYYDNDDVSINVIVPVYIPYVLSINDPQNATYNTSTVPIDLLTSKNSNISYSLNGAPLIQACNDCSSYTSSISISPGQNYLYVESIDLETLQTKNNSIYFTYYTPTISNENSNITKIKLERFISREGENLFNVSFNLFNNFNKSTIPNKNLTFFTYYNNLGQISNLNYVNSLYYNIENSSSIINIDGDNVELFKYVLTPSQSTSTFASNLGIINNTNSFKLSFILNMTSNYSFSELAYGSFVFE